MENQKKIFQISPTAKKTFSNQIQLSCPTIRFLWKAVYKFFPFDWNSSSVSFTSSKFHHFLQGSGILIFPLKTKQQNCYYSHSSEHGSTRKEELLLIWKISLIVYQAIKDFEKQNQWNQCCSGM